MSISSFKTCRVKSFVRRDSRITPSQMRAFHQYWPQFGLSMESMVPFTDIFGRKAPIFLEIGFGNGQSLLALAKSHPEYNFIGVETHKPGIGALMLALSKEQVVNVRIYYGDAFEVLKNSIADEILQGIQIFFPDPWPKRRHIERRLIQREFLALVTKKLQSGGSLHLATDWQDYAKQMLKAVAEIEQLQNIAGQNQFATRSPNRPLVTKFEQRAIREGRHIWELQFIKCFNL